MGANSHCHFAIFDLYETFNWMYFAKKVNFCLDCADVRALDAGSMLKVSSQNTYYPGKQLSAVLVFQHGFYHFTPHRPWGVKQQI